MTCCAFPIRPGRRWTWPWASVRPAPDRLAVLGATLALFREAARDSPLLIVIDDLQWLDRASGAVVGFVGRRLHGSRIGLLGAVRPGFGGFFERAGISEHEVLPLSERDAMQLLVRQFAHLPTRVLRGVVDDAQGIPLALLEFAASAGGPLDLPVRARARARGADAVPGQARSPSRPRPGSCSCSRPSTVRVASAPSPRRLAEHGGLGHLDRPSVTTSSWSTGRPVRSDSGIR